MMSRLLNALSFLCLLPLCPGALNAQDSKFVWGKVPDEDLKMTVYAEDTAAPAVVLFDVGNLKFTVGQRGIRYVFERHRRIKILKRAGFEYADVAIPFYHRENVKGLKAQVILPDGKKTGVDKSSFFDEKVNENWGLKKFAFPNVQEGAILEFAYSLESTHVTELQDWYFQDEIPVRWSELFLAIPEWFDYAVIQQGRPPDITEALTGTETFTFEYVVHRNSRPETVQVSPKVHYYLVAMKDVPALQMESFVTTKNDYLARIRFQLKSVTYPRSPVETHMSTWEELLKKLMDHDKFGKQFTRKNNYSKAWEEASRILAGAASPAEKADRLYAWLAGAITWDEQYRFFSRNSLSECFEQKKGSAGEINLLLLALMKEAGIEAHPVLLSTRSHGKMLDAYPFLAQFNHVMVLAGKGHEAKLYDVGSVCRPPGYPRVEALNGMGWVMKPGGQHWMSIEPPAGSSTVFFKGALSETGDLSGNLRGKFDGYEAIRHREQLLASKAGEHWHNFLAQANPEVRIALVRMENETAMAQPLQAEITCEMPSSATLAGPMIYFKPVLFPAFGENPFKLAERSYPVEIPYPINAQFVLQLELPEGYAVEEVPQSLNLLLPEKGGSFQYTVNVSQNILTVNYRLRIDQLEYAPDEYPGLKEFFDKVMAKQSEQVVLKSE